ncbi:hypothetical protein FKP32DRAFT_691969 [Trametes sanguinea]|nr:hypothetical protein FKP32DRAFT_691969 [Trametes sanguinea]
MVGPGHHLRSCTCRKGVWLGSGLEWRRAERRRGKKRIATEEQSRHSCIEAGAMYGLGRKLDIGPGALWRKTLRQEPPGRRLFVQSRPMEIHRTSGESVQSTRADSATKRFLAWKESLLYSSFHNLEHRRCGKAYSAAAACQLDITPICVARMNHRSDATSMDTAGLTMEQSGMSISCLPNHERSKSANSRNSSSGTIHTSAVSKNG